MTALAAALRRGTNWAVPATRARACGGALVIRLFLRAACRILRACGRCAIRWASPAACKNLPWLFTATFLTLLVAQPLYGALVARLPRARFIPFVYHFFVANLVLFWLLLTLDIDGDRRAGVFRLGQRIQLVRGRGVLVVHGRPVYRRARQAAVRVYRRRRHRWRASGPVITIGLSVPLGRGQSSDRGGRAAEAGGILRIPPRARRRRRRSLPKRHARRRAGVSAAPPSRRCPSFSARLISSVSPRGSACSRSARRSSISSRPISSRCGRA